MWGKCELCDRENELTFHHLIPRSVHKNKWFKSRYDKDELQRGIYICKHDCHKEIHRRFDAKLLGRELNTKEKILNEYGMTRYIRWVKKQDVRRPPD